MPGPPPTPSAKAAILGFPGKRKRNSREPKPVAWDGACPDWLGEHGRAWWAENAPVYEAMGTLDAASASVLAIAAECWETIRQTTATLRNEGLKLVTPTNGLEYPNPALGARKAAMQEFRACLAELGGGPGSRTRIQVPGKPDADPFDTHAQRKPTRRPA